MGIKEDTDDDDHDDDDAAEEEMFARTHINIKYKRTVCIVYILENDI